MPQNLLQPSFRIVPMFQVQFLDISLETEVFLRLGGSTDVSFAQTRVQTPAQIMPKLPPALHIYFF